MSNILRKVAPIGEARDLLKNLYRVFDECDCSLAEVNPLIVTGDGKVVALDAKLNFDSNALFRQTGIVAYRDLDEEDPAEIEEPACPLGDGPVEDLPAGTLLHCAAGGLLLMS